MKTIISSHILGFFDGWHPYETYELEDGTKWQLISPRVEVKWMTRPKASVLKSGERYFLKVKGMGPRQEVRPVKYDPTGPQLAPIPRTSKDLAGWLDQAIQYERELASRRPTPESRYENKSLGLASRNGTKTPLFTSSIAGDFTGFRDGAAIVLRNGSVWRILARRDKPAYCYCPDVELWVKGGQFVLRVDSCGENAVWPVSFANDPTMLDLLQRDPFTAATRIAVIESDVLKN